MASSVFRSKESVIHFKMHLEKIISTMLRWHWAHNWQLQCRKQASELSLTIIYKRHFKVQRHPKKANKELDISRGPLRRKKEKNLHENKPTATENLISNQIKPLCTHTFNAVCGSGAKPQPILILRRCPMPGAAPAAGRDHGGRQCQKVQEINE